MKSFIAYIRTFTSSAGAFFSRLSLGKLIPGAQKRSKQSRQEKRVKDADEKRSLPRRTLSVLLKIGFYSAVLGSLVGIGLLGYVIEVAEELPDVNALKNPNFELPSIIYDRNGKQVYELYVEKRILIKKEDIPQDVKNALIATEDSRFYEHSGIDVIRIVKAAIVNMQSGRIVEGASTITQQTAKLFFLTPEKSFKRKTMEALLALKIEKNFSKEEILELYLNKAYFGRHSRGIEGAASVYFDKPAKNLTLDQTALLIGLLKAPSALSPVRNPDGAKDRRNLVLQLMFRNGFITEAQLKESSAAEITIAPTKSNFYPEAEYYVEEIRRLLNANLSDKDDANTAGYRVYTYMDIDMQITAHNSLRKGLEELQQRKGFVKPSKNIAKNGSIAQEDIDALVAENEYEIGDEVAGVVTAVHDDRLEISLGINDFGYVSGESMQWALSGKNANLGNIIKIGDTARFIIQNYDEAKSAFRLQWYTEPSANGGFMAMNPYNGEVYAMIGGYKFFGSQYNRVTQSQRQPGSAFKPILYAAALDNGFTPASILNDNPYASEEDDAVWRPQNYSGVFSGFTSFRDSLVHSKNVPTVRLLQDIGVNALMNYINILGMDSKKFPRDFSIALGSASVSLSELMTAYSVFANGGDLVKPKLIRKITDRNGKVLFDYENESDTVRGVISPETAFLITSILQDVIRRGTGRAAAVIDRPVAGKTGTTNNYSDAWFIGYTPRLIAGTFIGNDTPSIPLGESETGGKAALPVWLSFMKESLKKYPSENFKQPPGIIAVKINPQTGYLACNNPAEDSRFEYFKAGTEPLECDPEEANPAEDTLTAEDPVISDGQEPNPAGEGNAIDTEL